MWKLWVLGSALPWVVLNFGLCSSNGMDIRLSVKDDEKMGYAYQSRSPNSLSGYSMKTWSGLFRSQLQNWRTKSDNEANEHLFESQRVAWKHAENLHDRKHLFLVETVGTDPRHKDYNQNITGSKHDDIHPVGGTEFYTVVTFVKHAHTLKHHSFIRRVNPVIGDLKISPEIHMAEEQARSNVYGNPKKTDLLVTVENAFDALLFQWSEILQRADLSNHIGRIHGNGKHAVISGVRISHLGNIVSVLAQEPEVHWVELRVPVKSFNKWARETLQSGQPLAIDDTIDLAYSISGKQTKGMVVNNVYLRSVGLTGEGQVVGVPDTGLDLNSCFFEQDCSAPFNVLNETCRKVVYYSPYVNEHDSVDGHGTHVSGTIVGHSLMNNTEFNGMAPDAKIAVFDIGDNNGSLYLPPDINTDLFQVLYKAAGACIQNLSWGASIKEYSSECRNADSFMFSNPETLIVVAAGNDGIEGSGTISSPASAKNVIAVGATFSSTNSWELVFGTADSDLGLYSPETLAYFSSQGPTSDGRIKPEVVAPGYYIFSAKSEGPGANSPTCSLSGLACMSAPVISGAALIVREYFMKGFYPTGAPVSADAFVPSGALLQAVLVSSGDQIDQMLNSNGSPIGPLAFPGNQQGYGRVDLSNALFLNDESVPSEVVNLLVVGSTTKDADGVEGNDNYAEFSRVNESHHLFMDAYNVTGSDHFVKVTLAWTDPPSAIGSIAQLVNDISLTVTELATGNEYVPVEGDGINNIKQVVLSSPDTSEGIQIRLEATQLAVSPQPFAVVAILSQGIFSEIATGTGFVDSNDQVIQKEGGLFESWYSNGWIIVYIITGVVCFLILSFYIMTLKLKPQLITT